MKTCFACHEKAKVSDLVFTQAPEAQKVYLADPPYGNGQMPKKALFFLDLREEAIKVAKIRHVSLYARYISSPAIRPTPTR